VAREWLYFLGCFLFGITILPPILNWILGGPTDKVSDFYKALFEAERIPWACVLAPYIVVQLVRSVVWAIGQLRGESNARSGQG
jgi:hypothetical protein